MPCKDIVPFPLENADQHLASLLPAFYCELRLFPSLSTFTVHGVGPSSEGALIWTWDRAIPLGETIGSFLVPRVLHF